MKRRLLIALAVLTASAGCIFVVQNGQIGHADLSTDPLAAGERAFLASCASCHGRDGRGDGPVALALRTPPSDLTLLTARSAGVFPRAYVIDVLAGETVLPAHGSREMPVWSDRFASEESGATAVASAYARRRGDALATYLESIQRRIGTAVDRR
jgi:mono/diheme cytochrome c family protein